MIFRKLLSKPLQFVFIIACLIALAYPVINIFIVFPSFKNVLVKDAEDIAGQIARHFSREAVSFNNLKDTPDFAEEAKRFEEEFKLEQMKVYSETGVIVYSSTPGEIGKINQDEYFREIVAKGNNYSKLVKKDSKTFEGRIVDADVVETYVPVIEEGRFVGAVEVYYDITLKNQAIVKKVFLYSVIPFSLMFILLVVVAVVLLKAEKFLRGVDSHAVPIRLSPHFPSWRGTTGFLIVNNDYRSCAILFSVKTVKKSYCRTQANGRGGEGERREVSFFGGDNRRFYISG
jgi:hypothetical protein